MGQILQKCRLVFSDRSIGVGKVSGHGKGTLLLGQGQNRQRFIHKTTDTLISKTVEKLVKTVDAGAGASSIASPSPP